MRTNTVRQKLKAGQPSVGCFMGLGSPEVAELMANAGFDWLVIETEHNALGPAEIQHMLMAMNGTDAIPIVRVPCSTQRYIQNALDIGAMGIMVPMVKSVEEARAVLAATRYPPRGTRGFGPLRASRFNFDRKGYYENADDNMLVMLVIETKEAWEAMDEIAAIDGIDVLFMGMSDLSLSLGMDLLKPDPKQMEAIERRALEIGRRHGVAIGCGIANAGQIPARIKDGFLLIGSHDGSMLAGAASALLAEREQ